MSMEKVRDFVCGMEIDKEKSTGSFDYQGKTYHFCSERCRDDFSKNPSSYIK
jgi:YHS domain-containing protein